MGLERCGTICPLHHKVTINTPITRQINEGVSPYLVHILCDMGIFRGEYGRTGVGGRVPL